MARRVEILGMKSFQAAMKRNPLVVVREGKNMIGKAIGEANKLLFRSPWKVGDRKGSGKGVPVDTGNLRKTHTKRVRGLEARLYPTAPYAKYVHGRKKGEVNSKTRVTSRPWLDNIAEDIGPKLKSLEKDLLKKISKDLAK